MLIIASVTDTAYTADSVSIHVPGITNLFHFVQFMMTKKIVTNTFFEVNVLFYLFLSLNPRRD